MLNHENERKLAEKVPVLLKTDAFIKNPNSFQKRLLTLLEGDIITEDEYSSELIRYNDFRIKKAIQEDFFFNKLLSEIEFKELFQHLGEIPTKSKRK